MWHSVPRAGDKVGIGLGLGFPSPGASFPPFLGGFLSVLGELQAARVQAVIGCSCARLFSRETNSNVQFCHLSFHESGGFPSKQSFQSV